MDVILHLGAHRTATATFHDYMHRHAAPLQAQKVAFWGPRRVRNSVFNGALDSHPGTNTAFARAQSRIERLLDHKAEQGMQTLVVSDPNVIGSIEENVDAAALYPVIGERVRRFARPFAGRIASVMLTVRSLEVYWSSAVAEGVARGQRVPSRSELHSIALDIRSWRDVLTELSEALPGVPLRVSPFEKFAGRPDALLTYGAGIAAPFDGQRKCLNAASRLPDLRRAVSQSGGSPTALPFGMGRWNPFTNEEHAILREKHADDMMWLTSGADGLATLTEDCLRDRAGPTPPRGAQAKGQRDELEERHMARPGRR